MGSPVTDDRQEDFSRRKRKYDSPLFSVKSGLSRFYCRFAVLSPPRMHRIPGRTVFASAGARAGLEFLKDLQRMTSELAWDGH